MSKLKDILKQQITTKIDPDTGDVWMPSKIVNNLGIKFYNNPDELRPIVQKVLRINPVLADKYRNGNKKVFGRILKEVFEETLNGADPELTKTLIDELLSS